MQKYFKSLFLSAIFLIAASCSNNVVAPIVYPDITTIDFPALYVVNGGSSNLYVVNLNTNEIAGKIDIKGSTFPHHISMNKDKSLLSVSCVNKDLSSGHNHGTPDTNGYKIYILKATDGTVSKTLTVDLMPHSAKFSPNADEFWVGLPEDGESNVTIFNAPNSTSLTWGTKATIPCGGDVRDIGFNTTGKFLYTVNPGTNDLTVISSQLKSIFATIPVPGTPIAIDGGFDNKMYISCESDKKIAVLDVATQTLESQIQLSFKPSYCAFNKVSGQVWVNDPDGGNVFVFEKTAGQWTQKAKISTGKGSHAIVFNLASSVAYISNELDGSISVIDAVKLSLIKNIAVGSKPNGLLVRE